MDPFEVRMQFLGLLRKLNATQQSIQKVVSYALKYFSRCGEDLWECIIEECQKGSINHRINILYFLDSLCESSLLAKAHQPPPPAESSSSHAKPTSFYVDYVSRDLSQIVECVVPVGRQGLPNLTSTKQILENWRTKRIIEPQRVEEAMHVLSARQSQAQQLESSSSALSSTTTTSTSTAAVAPPSTSTSVTSSVGAGSQQRGGVGTGVGGVGAGVGADALLSRGEIFKRIEEDRERHKRLRERRWVQAQPPSVPLSSSDARGSGTGTGSGSGGGTGTGGGGVGGASASASASASTWALATFLPLSASEDGGLALDIEFENEWEATSDWNEDDVEAVLEERELCWPGSGKGVGVGVGVSVGVGVDGGKGDRVNGSKVEELAEGEGGEEPMDLS